MLLAAWALLGIGYSATQTPSGRLLRRSAHAEDRPAVFAAQFALSHACWLVTYPVAGWLCAALPLATLATLFAAATLLAARLWPAGSTDALPHGHPELPPNHPIWPSTRDGIATPSSSMTFHPSWPSQAG